MALVISKKILVSNAFFAKQKKELKYEEIDKFRKILYKTIAKVFKFVLWLMRLLKLRNILILD